MSVYWVGLATGHPPRFIKQDECFQIAGYEKLMSESESKRVQAIFRASAVAQRALWLAEDDLKISEDPNDFHRRYLSGVRALVPDTAQRALASAHLEPNQVDFVVFVSCTGYSCPGYATELATALGVSEEKPVANLLGMGCSALVPGLARAYDHLVTYPGSRALVVAAEICSATYWVDHDPETAVGNALFGDGVAAMILSSCEEDLEGGAFAAKVEGFKTLRDGRYLSEMGFTQKDGRLRVRLSKEIPQHILPLVLRMLDLLEVPESGRLLLHPGGRKILDSLEESMKTEGRSGIENLKWSRQILRELGNMSSPSVAFVLERSIQDKRPELGEVMALLTMGPGISVEAMRMSWLKRLISQ